MIEILPLGWVFIPFGILLLLFNKRLLLYMIAFTAPLFYVSIAYVPTITFRFRLPYFFLILFAIGKVADLRINSKIRIYRGSLLLLLMVAFGAVSLLMPLYISENVYVYPIEGDGLTLLHFSTTNVTQFLYLLFFSTSAILISSELTDVRRIVNVLRISVLVGCVVVVSGIITQLSCVAGLDQLRHIAYLFIGADHVPTFQCPRMFSLTGEPGYTSTYLLFPLAIVAADIFRPTAKILWSRSSSKFIFAFLLTGILVSTGTSGYIGFGIFLAVSTSYALISTSRQRIRSIIYPSSPASWVMVVILAMLVVLASPIVVKYLLNTLLPKLTLEQGSGVVRLRLAKHALSLFLEYPAFGVGYGSNKSLVLIAGLLGNIGFIGTFSFIMYNICLGVQTFRTALIENSSFEGTVSLGLFFAITSIIPVLLFAKSLVALIFPWYWLIVAIPAGLFAKKGTDYRKFGSYSERNSLK